MAHTSPSTIRIQVWAQCGSFCVAADDGELIYDQIKRALDEGADVEVSFKGVESLSTAFLNSAVGQLVNDFDSETLNARLNFEDLAPDDREMLRRVIANARRYYSDPDRFRATQAELEAA